MSRSVRRGLAAIFLLIVVFGVAGCKSASTTSHGNRRLAGTNAPPGVMFFADTPDKRPVLKPKFSQKLNPAWWFGNIDDPVPPDGYRPGDPHRVRRWYCRNSLHNFTFYVFGIADKNFERVGYLEEGDGWRWAVCKYKWLRLPFLAYNRRGFHFYIGWRDRGNFGVKLNF